jgi:hypothetical protein
MAGWEFMEFVKPASGRKAVSDWLDDLPVGLRQQWKLLLRTVRKQAQWRKPEFRRLTGKQQGLGEFRLRADKPYRIIGVAGPGLGQYSLLIGCTHNAKVYTPNDALETADKRRRQIERGDANVVQFRPTEGPAE